MKKTRPFFSKPITITGFLSILYTVVNDIGMTLAELGRSSLVVVVGTYTVDDEVDPGREEDGHQDSEQEHEQADRDHDPCNTHAYNV